MSAEQLGDLQLSIGASLKDLKVTIAEAQGIIAKFADQSGSDFGRAGRGASEAGGHIGGLSGSLKEFSSEQRQQGRVASFFVRELADIAPVSDSAKVAMTGLIGAMAGGFGAGMVFDLALTGIKLLLDEIRSAGKELEEVTRKSVESAEKASRAVDDLRSKRKTPAEKANEQRRLAELELENQRAIVEEVTMQYPLGSRETRAVTDPRIVQARERISVLEQLIPLLREKVRLELEDADKAGQQAADERRRSYIEMLEKGTGTYQESHIHQWFKGLEEDKKEALEAGTSPDATSHERDQFAMMMTGGFYGEGDINRANLKSLIENQKKVTEQVQKTSAAYERWGTVGGDVIGGLITRQMTLRQAAVRVGQSVIQETSRAAIASITADAARAAAGAAAAESGIPIIGPVLAISAMAAMLSSVLGLLNRVPSAAGGWDRVPKDTLAMIHEDEQVLSAPYARGLRRLIDNGGGGGDSYTVVAFNAKDVERQLMDSRSALARAQQRNARRRRNS